MNRVDEVAREWSLPNLLRCIQVLEVRLLESDRIFLSLL